MKKGNKKEAEEGESWREDWEGRQGEEENTTEKKKMKMISAEEEKDEDDIGWRSSIEITFPFHSLILLRVMKSVIFSFFQTSRLVIWMQAYLWWDSGVLLGYTLPFVNKTYSLDTIRNSEQIKNTYCLVLTVPVYVTFILLLRKNIK